MCFRLILGHSRLHLLRRDFFGKKFLCPDQDYLGPPFRPPFTTQNSRFWGAVGTFWRGLHFGAQEGLFSNVFQAYFGSPPASLISKRFFGKKFLCPDQGCLGPPFRPPFATQNSRFWGAVGTFWRVSRFGVQIGLFPNVFQAYFGLPPARFILKRFCLYIYIYIYI